MKIVIMGCGRLGIRIAQKMSNNNEVIVVDKNLDELNKLGKDFNGKVLQGDGTNMEIYETIMQEKPDVFLALTNSDNVNIMAAEIAKQKYKVENVIARVDNPVKAKAFEEIGIDTFSPTILGEKIIYEMLKLNKNGQKEGEKNGK